MILAWIIPNPFVPNVTFLYPLKTSENCKVVEKGCIGNKLFNESKRLYEYCSKIVEQIC